MSDQQFFTVSEIARILQIPPRKISDALYQRRIPDDKCQVVGGRRLIPISLLPQIKEVLGL